MPNAAGFTHGRSETLGANTGTSTGTVATASASVNTKGAWTALGTPSFGYDFVNLNLAQTVASDKLVDLGVNDGSGNWHVIAENLRIPGRKYADFGRSFALPLRFRAGLEIGIRLQASTASHQVIATLTGSSAGMKGAPAYSRMVALFTQATSRGPTVDPGATPNTKGAWVQLTASTPVSVDAVFLVVGQNADTARTAASTALIDIGVGSAANEFAMIPNLLYRYTTTGDSPFPDFVGPIPCAIPVGSRVVARSQCTDATAGDRAWDCCLYGFVP